MHDRDTTADGTGNDGGKNTDATRGGSSRRRFLKASTAAAAGAFALGAGASPAAARRTECSSQGSLSVGGDFQIINNDWGTQEEGADVDMCVFANDDGSYGYEWSTRSAGGSPNYPQALIGTKPWGTDTGVAEFPIRRGEVDQLEIEIDVNQSISGGEWDLAEEWWLMEQPPSQATGTHVHEVMMVLDWGGGHGHYMEERDVWTDQYGNTIDYWADYDGGGTSADFHIFRVRGGLTSGRVDLTPVIDFLSQRHGVSDDLWLSGVELGNEYWQGAQGDVTFEQFDVTINGTTYASGSSGDSGGGGGSGGTDGGSSGGSDGGSDGSDGTDGGSDDGGSSDDGTGDDSGGSSSPIAEIDPSTTSADVGERITFRVNDTSGTGRYIDSMEWEFDDGTTGSGWWQGHSYDSPGTYTVALTATANTGETTTHEVTIAVS